MKKIRATLIVLGLLIAITPTFLSVWEGFKNGVITTLGLIVALLSYFYIHEQQSKK